MREEKYIADTALKMSEVINAGLYFLLDRGKIVYVGQSKNILGRIGIHNKGKRFDSYKPVSCPSDAIDFWESYYILKYNPKYNKVLPKNKYFKTLSFIKNEKGVNKWIIKRYIKTNGIREVSRGYYLASDFEGLKS